MTDPNIPLKVLPDGVRLTRSADGRSFELVISAADGDELAWRIHDLIPLIQTGELKQIIAAASDRKSDPARPATQGKPSSK